MLTLRQAPPDRAAPRRADWPSPASIPRLWLTAAFAVSAGFAVILALATTYDAHRLWGVFASCSYLLAAMAVLVWKSRGLDVALAISLAGALAAPMWLMAADRLQQPEVQVIDKSAAMLLSRGTPYPGPAMLAATHNPNVFDPYLPALTAFGIPRVLLGFSPVTDPRIWFGAGFVVVFGAALVLAGARDVARWTALVTASPVIALSLTVGGTDVPVLACMCLGLALLWRRPRPVAAGLALGVAAAMKATAWPALAVAAVLLLARDGRRAAVSMSATALLVVAAVVGPVAVAGPRSLVQNTIEFPLGLTRIKSAAVSPLPGRLLAETGHTGHLVAVALLALAGLAVIASLVTRPPRTVPAATWYLIIGLTAMFVLAPATRFGYFVYPVGLFAWLEVSLMGQPQDEGPAGALLAGPARQQAHR
ncbi:MAG TPA: glycosyltransferase 87 family protein [Streptosporangiaceae bacterium]|nr:glycosyltransferase 87 family protein [Streptosporangiaceae bacterium]